MYEQQMERVERWYKRLSAVTQGKMHDSPLEYDKDDFYAFFLNCYHLKDWIINDDGLKLDGKKEKVDAFIKANYHLSVCSDICNGLKHLKRNQKPRSGTQPKFVMTEHIVHVAPAGLTIRTNYRIDTAHGPMDAFQLATQCVNAWRDFTKTKLQERPQRPAGSRKR